MTTTNGPWHKSSYSAGNGGQCLEWAPSQARTGTVPVRNSKDTDRAPLRFSTTAWTTFVGSMKH
ncbi:DUF397 domain-containing protein [Streptomyces spirodelae]|uniref:DUF397 domain-containing protein n=1 Tax=Streptomyces spirodelae TaxID=2812904 RepID=A0ABS3WSX3_9ACTN|nr:DUF397 domain-containing protein [Streptomyces spirodelae]MBO8186230.1 DUF397 domain-containing protein [Streptomyces spirodelae]